MHTMLALQQLHADYGAKSSDVKVSVYPITQQKVVCAKSFKKGELVLVPVTQQVRIKDKLSPGDIKAGMHKGVFGGDFNLTLCPMRCFRAPDKPADGTVELLHPFWVVERVKHNDEANCVLKTRTVTVTTSAITARTMELDLPVLENSKLVKLGDELKLFVGKAWL